MSSPGRRQALFAGLVFSEENEPAEVVYLGVPWRFLVWSVALSLASTVGVLRYVSGSHFPSDIITGALVGSAVGVTVPLLHRISKRRLMLRALRGDISGMALWGEF